jgi:hypothetical protein
MVRSSLLERKVVVTNPVLIMIKIKSVGKRQVVRNISPITIHLASTGINAEKYAGMVSKMAKAYVGTNNG